VLVQLVLQQQGPPSLAAPYKIKFGVGFSVLLFGGSVCLGAFHTLTDSIRWQCVPGHLRVAAYAWVQELDMQELVEAAEKVGITRCCRAELWSALHDALCQQDLALI